FGRLIRSKTDRGVMVVLDSRLSTRNYGSVFVNSLPQCRLERGPSRNLPKAVQDWLGEMVDEGSRAIFDHRYRNESP
ncbi:hypothetical protein M1N22_00795, partial [Dehalococcoidia bacterium]|nr:hypothetical protein [Dehalococcoidia bacterium]